LKKIKLFFKRNRTDPKLSILFSSLGIFLPPCFSHYHLSRRNQHHAWMEPATNSQTTIPKPDTNACAEESHPSESATTTVPITDGNISPVPSDSKTKEDADSSSGQTDILPSSQLLPDLVDRTEINCPKITTTEPENNRDLVIELDTPKGLAGIMIVTVPLGEGPNLEQLQKLAPQCPLSEYLKTLEISEGQLTWLNAPQPPPPQMLPSESN
jgi:hypothetical protein